MGSLSPKDELCLDFISLIFLAVIVKEVMKQLLGEASAGTVFSHK